MKIKTLNLYAFGKFENTTIELSDGFNLIFGPNEAGKSTIQAFIEGMFFGFYKPYRKRRTYSEDYKRYRPLYNDKYYGSMIIVDDSGREIRIERDFLQERDGVRIFDNLTGEDITTTYPYDAATKQYLPLGYDGVNASIYNNTVNFKQMATYSDEDLAKEVNNRLVDMASGGDTDISVSGVIDYLEDKKKHVGTFRRSRSNYGLAVRKKERLEASLETAEKNDQRIRQNQKHILQYQKSLARYEKKRDDRTEQRRQAELAAVDNQKRKADAVRAEGEALSAQRDALKKRGEYYDPKVYDHLHDLNRTGEALAKQSHTITEEIAAAENDTRKVERKWRQLDDRLAPYDARQVEIDFRQYREAVGKRQQITRNDRYASPQETDTNINREAPLQEKNSMDLRQFVSYGRSPYIAMFIIGVALAIIGFANPASYFVFAAQFVLIAAGLFLLAVGIIGNVLVARTDIHDDLYDEPIPYQEGGEDKENNSGLDFLSDETETFYDVPDGQDSQIIDELLRIYDCRSEAEYEKKVRRLRDAFSEQRKLRQKVSDNNVHLRSLKKQQADIDHRMTDAAREIKDILEPLGLTDITDYGKGRMIQDDLKALDAKIEANRTLLENMDAADYVKMPNDQAFMNRTESVTADKSLDRSIKTIQREIATLEGQNQTLMGESEMPVALKEQIERIDGELQTYEDEIKACDMAEAFFKRYQKQSHNMGAGDLNEKIGDILSQITHRYHDVRIDDKLNIKVVSPSTGTLVGMDQLSGGTLDQIYFALRFGVRDLFDTQQSLPFILDDPFVQYDDTRKKAALTFLNEMSQTDQILLFTCSSDEKRIMDAEGIPYIGLALV